MPLCRPSAVAIVACALATLAACGPSREERLGRAVADGAEPAVAAFVADVAAGRVDEARARGTEAFRSAVPADAMREVVQSMRAVLGAPGARTFREATGLAAGEGEDVAWGATLVYDAAFEKGGATLSVRVRRTRTPRWEIDGCVVEGAALTWTLRP